MIEWKNIGNMEIRQKMESMSLEYEAIKNKINNLINQMDELDVEYNKAKNELERRTKK